MFDIKKIKEVLASGTLNEIKSSIAEVEQAIELNKKSDTELEIKLSKPADLKADDFAKLSEEKKQVVELNDLYSSTLEGLNDTASKMQNELEIAVSELPKIKESEFKKSSEKKGLSVGLSNEIEDTDAYKEAFYLALKGDNAKLMAFGISDPSKALLPTSTVNKIADQNEGGQIVALCIPKYESDYTTIAPYIKSKTKSKRLSESTGQNDQDVTVNGKTITLEQFTKTIKITYQQQMLSIDDFENWIIRELMSANGVLADDDILNYDNTTSKLGCEGIKFAGSDFVTKITPASVTELTETEVLSVKSAVKKNGRMNLCWVMSENIYVSLIRSIKGGDGRSLFPIEQTSDGMMLEGYPVVFSDVSEDIFFASFGEYALSIGGLQFAQISTMPTDGTGAIQVSANTLIGGALTGLKSAAYIALK